MPNCTAEVEEEKVFFSLGSLESIENDPANTVIKYEGNRVVIFVKSVVTDITIERSNISENVQEIYLVRESGNTQDITLHWNRPVYLNGIVGPSTLKVNSGNLIHLVRQEFHDWILVRSSFDMTELQANMQQQNWSLGDGAWNGSHMTMGAYHFWVDNFGVLRIKNGAPTSHNDGTVVGMQA